MFKDLYFLDTYAILCSLCRQKGFEVTTLFLWCIFPVALSLVSG